MATDAEVNANLDGGVRILQAVNSNDGKISYYVDGGQLAPGRYRWIDCNISDDAVTQAEAIEAAIGG
jgi:hypothetical protein